MKTQLPVCPKKSKKKTKHPLTTAKKEELSMALASNHSPPSGLNIKGLSREGLRRDSACFGLRFAIICFPHLRDVFILRYCNQK